MKVVESKNWIIITGMSYSLYRLVLLLIYGLACNYERENKYETENKIDVLPIASLQTLTVEDYSDHIKNSLKLRDSLSTLFNSADQGRRREILQDASLIFTSVMTNEIFPPWYGTPWDFNGTTQEPGKGSIACGYFVTTTLRDAGLKIQRIKTAQQAADVIVSIIASRESIKRFSDEAIEVIQKSMKERGDGLYIVGLDFHVGFLQQIGDTTRFIHSNYLNRSGVMKESPWQNSVFYHSRYKVIAKISEDKKVLENWLGKNPLRTRTN